MAASVLLGPGPSAAATGAGSGLGRAPQQECFGLAAPTWGKEGCPRKSHPPDPLLKVAQVCETNQLPHARMPHLTSPQRSAATQGFSPVPNPSGPPTSSGSAPRLLSAPSLGMPGSAAALEVTVGRQLGVVRLNRASCPMSRAPISRMPPSRLQPGLSCLLPHGSRVSDTHSAASVFLLSMASFPGSRPYSSFCSPPH